jgi:uncharacterized membrane protein
MSALSASIASGVTMLFLDAIYLTLRSNYHKAFFQHLQGSPLNARLFPAAIVYAIMIALVYLYAIQGAVDAKDAALRGALLGALAYGFYDVTNYATLTRWTLEMTLGDILWGTALMSATAYVGYGFSTSTAFGFK